MEIKSEVEYNTNTWCGVQIRNPHKMIVIEPFEFKKPTWAERQVWELRSKRLRFKRRMDSFYLILITIFGILPLIISMSVLGAIWLHTIGCGEIGPIWGVACGLLGIFLFILAEYYFDRY